MPLQGHLPWPLHAWDALAKLPCSPCAHLAGLQAPTAQEALLLLSPAFLPSASLGPQRGPGLPQHCAYKSSVWSCQAEALDIAAGETGCVHSPVLGWVSSGWIT